MKEKECMGRVLTKYGWVSAGQNQLRLNGGGIDNIYFPIEADNPRMKKWQESIDKRKKERKRSDLEGTMSKKWERFIARKQSIEEARRIKELEEIMKERPLTLGLEIFSESQRRQIEERASKLKASIENALKLKEKPCKETWSADDYCVECIKKNGFCVPGMLYCYENYLDIPRKKKLWIDGKTPKTDTRFLIESKAIRRGTLESRVATAIVEVSTVQI